MTRKWICWAIVAISAFCSGANPASAQSSDFGPRPTFSPWFGLYQRNGGPLDNYHTFVRPRMSLNNSLMRQQADIQRNYLGISSLNRNVDQIREGEVRPTGTGSVYFNYSHYYPMNGQGSRSSAPASSRSWRPQPASSGRAMASMAGGF